MVVKTGHPSLLTCVDVLDNVAPFYPEQRDSAPNSSRFPPRPDICAAAVSPVCTLGLKVWDCETGLSL